MSTSLLYHAFQIKGVKYKSISYEPRKITFYGSISDSFLRCPECKSQNICLKGQKNRLFHLPPIGRRECFLNIRVHKIFCKICCKLHWGRLPFMKGKSPFLIPIEGSIVVYHASYESTRLKELAVDFPEYGEALLNIKKRLVDLEVVIKEGIYYPEFMGSFSIKNSSGNSWTRCKL